MSKAALDFNVEESKGVRVVRLSGPLDSATYDQCKVFLDPLMSRPGARVVLDCQNLTYVNSRGVTLLMHYQRTATTSYSFFGIASLRRHTLKSIEMLGLGKMLTVYPTLENALEMAAAM